MTEKEKQEQRNQLIADIARTVRDGVAEDVRAQADKMAEDLALVNRQVAEIKADLVTIEKGEEVNIDLKPIFEGKDFKSGTGLSSIAGMYSLDTGTRTDHMGVRKALYMPRTKWNAGQRVYTRKESYEGLEGIMELNDMCYFAALAISHKNKIPFDVVLRSLDSWKLLNAEIQNHTDLRRALDSTQNADFIPTQFSASLLDDVRLQLKVAALFQRLQLPRSPFTNPVKGARQVAYLVGESTSDSSNKIPTSDPISKNMTFTAVKFAVRNLFSDEFAEDSIVPVLPWVRSELVQAMADAEEDAIQNGDNASTHQHSDVTAANDRRKAYDGLLLHSGASAGAAAVDIGTLSTANLRSIRKKMGRFGVDSSNLAWVTSISGYIQMLSLTEVMTVDKYGAMATVLSGEMGKFDGAPIVVSEFSRQDLNATGTYDATTITKTNILLVSTPSFLIADFGAAKAESDRDIETQQTIVVTSRRTDFQQIHTPGSSEETVGVGYNLTS